MFHTLVLLSPTAWNIIGPTDSPRIFQLKNLSVFGVVSYLHNRFALLECYDNWNGYFNLYIICHVYNLP